MDRNTVVDAKKWILFVDDDPAVLAALANVLRRERHRWEMVFTSDGEAALAELARRPFDVVISDMRMPGLSGEALLAKVKDASPHTACVVLSGSESDLTPIGADQLLSKPCSAKVLRETIERLTSA